jgi:hypothetical protein
MKNIILAASILALLANCAGNKVMFDDFSYASHDEMRSNGWIIRTEAGWPGVPGATWGPESVTLTVEGVRMTSSTDGTPANTRQNQICHARKYLEGTYAARVRFTDVPVSGPNGDQIVQTLYMIAPLRAPMDLNYSEADFEYLPNGGWGKTGATMWATTWETFHPEPQWKADNESGQKAGSHAGWRTLVAQIFDGHVRYYVDGDLLADHSGRVYPEEPMSINFNLWFIRDGLAKSTEMRRWEEDIDWVYFNGGHLTPASVEKEVAALKAKGVRFRDTVPAIGLTSPCNF